jgi:hypothetical protein
MAIETRRIDILLNIFIGLIGSFFVAGVIYFNDMYAECDKFCRGLPRRLDRISHLIDELLVGLCEYHEIKTECGYFFEEYLRYGKSISNKKLKKLVDNTYELIMVKLNYNINILGFSLVNVKNAENEYKTLKNGTLNSLPVIRENQLSSKKKYIESIRENPKKHIDKISEIKNDLQKLREEICDYYLYKAKIKSS